MNDTSRSVWLPSSASRKTQVPPSWSWRDKSRLLIEYCLYKAHLHLFREICLQIVCFDMDIALNSIILANIDVMT